MTPLEAGLLGLVIGAVVMEALHHMDAAIPEGWEDAETGFHYGRKPLTPLARRALADATPDSDPDVINLAAYAEAGARRRGA